jgi:hypothetical protein
MFCIIRSLWTKSVLDTIHQCCLINVSPGQIFPIREKRNSSASRRAHHREHCQSNKVLGLFGVAHGSFSRSARTTTGRRLEFRRVLYFRASSAPFFTGISKNDLGNLLMINIVFVLLLSRVVFPLTGLSYRRCSGRPTITCLSQLAFRRRGTS